jgi:transcriptional regulator with XRE-family HTH domain
MAVSKSAARVSFARFVRRAVDGAKDDRGWSVTRLAAETGVGRSTLFRWLAGDWQDFPEVATVRGFCRALDIPVSAAFSALGVRDTGPGLTDDPGVAADLRTILDRLADPHTPAADKAVIRDMLHFLAGRSAAPQLSVVDSESQIA